MRESKATQRARMKAELDKKFHEYHEIGANKHGYAWMRMNELMVYAAIACGVDYAEQPFKTLLSLCALKALNQIEFTEASAHPPSIGHQERTVSKP